jgi:hypothetical protein
LIKFKVNGYFFCDCKIERFTANKWFPFFQRLPFSSHRLLLSAREYLSDIYPQLMRAIVIDINRSSNIRQLLQGQLPVLFLQWH